MVVTYFAGCIWNNEEKIIFFKLISSLHGRLHATRVSKTSDVYVYKFIYKYIIKRSHLFQKDTCGRMTRRYWPISIKTDVLCFQEQIHIGVGTEKGRGGGGLPSLFFAKIYLLPWKVGNFFFLLPMLALNEFGHM